MSKEEKQYFIFIRSTGEKVPVSKEQHDAFYKEADRIRHNGHKPCVVWLTGLSGSGKSTLANTVEQKLFENGIHTYVLDGDNIRHGLNSNVDFSPEGRKENIRRIGEAAKLFVDAGMVVLTAFISPYRADLDLTFHHQLSV